MSHMAWRGVTGILLAGLMTGCMPLGVTALGVGGSTAVSHTLNGITYRTFTASSGKVKHAALAALNRMEIKIVSTTKQDKTEILNATASGRTIQVQLEPLTSNTTRMRVTATNGGLIYDSATATEIILQTERMMEGSA
ncbi:MAG: DUF3568 family protein [Methylophilaceae bacterium]|jgi:hypothetical protein|uniref:DUF3568 family protein n=1 Tax=Methylobacillus sp. MM3 TaxID=1848039 RepID=UPI0009EE1A2D|nr:DUF3568 family protein [Methylobacillus sp. MM3]